ncbi:MAG: putative metal-dependent hydrolase [Candidatus Korobacteraceae bacterium]
MSDLRYPIGKFTWVAPGSEQQSAKDRVLYIDTIAKLPANLRAAVEDLKPAQLDTPYRPEGWTVRQVVHHVPESHMNAYIRFKLAITEDQPQAKPYNEAAWAKLPDNHVTPIETSLQLVTALHSRWVDTLRCMQSSDFGRTLSHPEHGVLTLDRMLAMYAWHCDHHVAHITSLRERMGWNRLAAAQQ